METQQQFGNKPVTANSMRFVGWTENSPFRTKFLSPETVGMVSKRITHFLKGIDQLGRDIVVPDETILNVMDQVLLNFRPEVGDIFTRHHIINKRQFETFNNLINEVVEIIVSQIKNEEMTLKCNRQLSVWNTIYGEHNAHGLRQHAPIKINRKRPQSMAFFENY